MQKPKRHPRIDCFCDEEKQKKQIRNKILKLKRKHKDLRREEKKEKRIRCVCASHKKDSFYSLPLSSFLVISKMSRT